MTTEREVVGLLYRADWTGLSLAADVRGMVDRGLRFRQLTAHAPRVADTFHGAPEGIVQLRGRLLVTPAGHCRVETTDRDDVFVGEPDGPVSERVGVISERLNAESLLHPARLLSGYTLAVRGPVTVAGRDAVDVVATPSPWRATGAWRSAPGHGALDRIEAVVDAETGILLRRAEIFEGQTLELTEITAARFGPLTEADATAARFAEDEDLPEDDEDLPEDDARDRFGGSGFNPFEGTGWRAARTATNAAGAVVGGAIRYAPRRGFDGAGGGGGGGGRGGGADAEAAMPADEPVGTSSDSGAEAGASAEAVREELAYALYRSGTASLSGTLHHWIDLAVLTDWLRSAADRHGWNGVGAFVGAVGDHAGTAHRVWRIRTGAGGKYRIDYVLGRQQRKRPSTIACDGQLRWRVYENRVTVGPPGPVAREITAMIDASWLLQCELSEVREVMFGGRRAFALRVASGTPPYQWPLMISEAQAVVDAELGVVLFVVSRANGRVAIRAEFRDVSARDAGGDGDFVVDVSPGVRVVHQDGGLLDEADLPEPVLGAARAARTAARTAETTITAAKEFLDSLRGGRPRE